MRNSNGSAQLLSIFQPSQMPEGTASRQIAINIQTEAAGLTISSHGTALMALPIVKKRLVVPA